MKLNRPFIFLFFCLVSLSLAGQNINPGVDDIFRPNEIAIIRLTLAPEHKAFLQDPENSESEEYFPAVFQMTNSQFDVTLEDEVGVRLRGNTSRGHNKKPFKIDFREFGGSKFHGYKKFNLKPNANDPSLVREPLTLKLYREMNIPAARTHFVKLYMNDEYMGVYLNVEQIDDEFLNLRHGHEEGFLYKCSYGASLQNHNAQIYNPSIFESELNEDNDTRSELAHFVDVLNNTSSELFKTEIEKVFDVELYLRQLAIEALTGHWDGYSYNMNNFYLFYNDQRKLFEFFPYDADNTWGIDWVGKDWASRDLKAWYKDDPRPLTTRILGVQEYRQKYYDHLKELIELYFNEEYVSPVLDEYKAMLSDAVEDDLYFDDSFGFTYNNFLTSFDVGLTGNHVKYGIREYLQLRTQYAAEQIPDDVITDTEEELEEIKLNVYPNPSENPRVFISSTVISGELIVHHVSGIQIQVRVQYLNNTCREVIFPDTISQGLYLIQLNGKVVKWVYQN